jgi:membrane protein
MAVATHGHGGGRLRRAVLAALRATASQRVNMVAAGCAFYATLALFPTITMLISLYGLVFNPHNVQPQLAYLRNFMPPAAFSLISDRINTLVAAPARGLGLGFGISLAISLWSSSTGTKSILNALSLAYHERETRGFWRFQIVSLAMTLIAIIASVMAIGFLVAVPVVLAFLGATAYAKFLAGLISYGAMIAFLLMALALLYRFGPAQPLRERGTYAPGTAIAAVAWLAVSWAFGFYMGHFGAYSVTYGPLAAIIGLMMWFYFTSYAVLFGAEVNAALDREVRRDKRRERYESTR